jgi:hypothetical protein
MAMVDAMKPYTDTPGFDPELVKSKSFAASGKSSLFLKEVYNVNTMAWVVQNVKLQKR